MTALERASPRALRENNKRRVLEHLLEAPQGLTRPELARLLGLTVPAIAGLVSGNGESLSAVLERSSATTEPSRVRATGPSPEVVRVKAALGHVLGIVLSHAQIRVAIADLQGTYVESDATSEPWDVDNDLHGALARAAAIGKDLADSKGLQPEAVAAIGVSIAAPVHVFERTPIRDERRRALLRLGLGPPALKSPWLNIDPLAALANHLGALPDGDRWRAIPLHVDNDANLGALGELKQGAGRGARNVFYIRVDEGGIGAGLVFDGRSYWGSGGIAGELGHVILEPDREIECRRCGRPCVESVIGSMLGCRNGACDPPLDQLIATAVAGDPTAKKSIAAAADYLGRALAPFVTVLNVDRILIGGPFPPQSYSLVIPPIQAALDRLTIVPVTADYVLELGALREDAVLRGAIWLALERARVDYLLRRAALGPPDMAMDAPEQIVKS
jgi:predicted NBD/HSP70 family sugar kinase